VVREAAVELEVHRRRLERQALEDGRHGVAAHAVAASTTTFSGRMSSTPGTSCFMYAA
jgi:hypothetical protein